MKELKVILINLLLSVFLISGYHFFLVQKRLMQIKVFDLSSYISLLRTLYLENKINDKELISYLRKIRNVLASQPEGVIILPAAVVLNKEKVEEIKLKDKNLLKMLKELEKERKERGEKNG